jgi:hypothetical protein
VRLAVFFRVVLYLIFGCATVLGVLAVRTYPAERTWADELSAWNRSRIHRNNWTPRPYRRDCDWWRVGCRDLPRPNGPLARAFAGDLDRVTDLECSKWTAYDGRLPRDAQEFVCQGQDADTAIGLAISDSGLALHVSKTWRPNNLDSTYAEILRARETDIGPSALCPQSDDLAIKDNRRWQLAETNIGIARILDSLIATDIDLGRIYCHTV